MALPASGLNVYLTGQSNATGEFATGIRSELGTTVLQHRFPGEPIENWYNNGQIQSNLQYDLDRIAGTDTNIVVWFQGENNYNNYSNYESNFWGLYNEFKKQIGSHMKFYMMGVHSPTLDTSGINSIQRKIEKQNGRIWLLKTDLYTRVDDWHMHRTTYDTLGRNVAKKMKWMVEWN